MTGTSGACYVVDDDPTLRDAVALLLEETGRHVRTFPNGAAFLRLAGALPRGCVLLDIRMPGSCGLGIQRELAQRGLPHPVVIMTAHASVALAVQAMKEGACDVIEKPFSAEALLRCVEAALAHGQAPTSSPGAEAASRLGRLSARETEVLRHVVAGRQNKEIARDLGLSPRTVESYRCNAMGKIGATSLPEAVRIALEGGLHPLEAP
ncbi:response regulator transcription factor [Sabulicella glaciei]|uniref:Response regulator n=1 Tax=Sabulicella glaciei TaxID=2984948 RepID=A0ABT3NYI8_9PROT|nr:response regulator [Roseococcus sp. MDT2-1-1]MCW8087224.1 response regulator [Roseococcus sp. MDT2-1-1]